MSISFNTIPSGIRVPLFYAEMDNSAAYTPTNTSQSLLIGQKLESGTAEEGVPVTVSTVAMAKKLFGRGSMLARMVDAYRTVDSFGQLVCIPLADGQSAGAAAGKVEITGTALEAGTLSFYIGGERLQVAVKEGDTGAQIAIALSDEGYDRKWHSVCTQPSWSHQWRGDTFRYQRDNHADVWRNG